MSKLSSLSTQEIIDWHLRPERVEELDPFMIVTYTPIDQYDHVADIGCGPGYFTLPLAKHLVHGKLYALDIEDRMLEAVRMRVGEAKLGNVEALKCGVTDFPLTKGSIDGALLSLVTQEAPDRADFLRAVRDLLKPGGWCTILEWHKALNLDDAEVGAPFEDPIHPAELEELLRSVGFRVGSSRNIAHGYYMAMARR